MLDSFTFHHIETLKLETYATVKWLDLVIKDNKDESFCISLFTNDAEGKILLLQELRDASIKALDEINRRMK
jgi:phage terminase large subunit-like protein